MKTLSTIVLDMVLPLCIGFTVGVSLIVLIIYHFVLGIIV